MRDPQRNSITPLLRDDGSFDDDEETLTSLNFDGTHLSSNCDRQVDQLTEKRAQYDDRPIYVLVLRYIDRVLLNGRTPLRFVLDFLRNLVFVLIWITTFKNARLISPDIRPAINVRVLETRDAQVFAVDNVAGVFAQVFIGAYGWLWASFVIDPTLSSLPTSALPFFFAPLVLNGLHHLAQGDLHMALDVLAWLSYGVIHFVSPFFCAVWLWLFAPSGIVGCFGWSFGIQNCIGIAIHLLYPTAAPWYGDQYGYPLPEGNYTMPGSPAGLVRVDRVLGTHLYTNAFKQSPLVFGAFPSLHGAFSCCCLFFMGRSSSRAKWIVGAYVCWQWWATMYLRHHWRLDLIGGLFVSGLGFTLQLPAIHRAEVDDKRRNNGWNRLFAGTRLHGYWDSSSVMNEPNEASRRDSV